MLTLQATAGNRAVSRLVDRSASLTTPGGLTVQRLVPLPQPEPGSPGSGGAPAGPLPPTPHPTLRKGSRGPDVEELQTKLNNVGATPPLEVDGIFGKLTKAAVVAFQSANALAPDGIAGPLTWGALDAAQPGEPGSDTTDTTDTDTTDTDTTDTDTTDTDTTDPDLIPLPLIRGRPQARPTKGTGTHPTLRKGDRGPAVEELQEKLNPATPLFPGPDVVPVTGFFDQRTEDEVKSVQAFISVKPTGVVDDRTWEALDVFHPGTSVGRVEKKWTEVVEGEEPGMTSRYTWRITAGEVRVTVTLAFTGDAVTTPLLSTFVAQIRAGVAAHWNRFAAKDEFTGDTLPIVFDMQPVTGAADNEVQLKHCVDPANEACRSDAGTWFVNSPGQSLEFIAAHEFGHMIGLEDEYKRGHGDFRRVVGEDATGTPHPNPDQVARELNEALHSGEIPILDDLFADTDARADECQRIVTRHGLGLDNDARAISVADAYQRLFPGDAGRDDALVQDIIDELPAERQGFFIEMFTLSSSSLMGQTANQASADPHDHPIEARHVREFVEAVQKFRPAGVWGAVPLP